MRSRQMLTDAISSTLAQTNAQGGGLANSYGYSPYGETSAAGPDATGNTAQYTGRENDAQGATGLYFYRARFYDPVLKRFISEDPIGLAGGANVYAYVNGNPVSFNDPTGLVYRNGNNFSQIPPPGPGCQKAVWVGGYIMGWKPCDTPNRDPMQCKADPLPFNPPENPKPAPPPAPPGQPQAGPGPGPMPLSQPPATGGPGIGLGLSGGGFAPFGCTASGSVQNSGMSSYAGCGIGLGAYGVGGGVTGGYGFGNPTGWGVNVGGGGGVFGGGTVDVFITTTGVNVDFGWGVGGGAGAGITHGWRGVR